MNGGVPWAQFDMDEHFFFKGGTGRSREAIVRSIVDTTYHSDALQRVMCLIRGLPSFLCVVVWSHVHS